MSSTATTRLTGWLDAGDAAQNRYGYEGAGRAPIEADIRNVLVLNADLVAVLRALLDDPAHMEAVNRAKARKLLAKAHGLRT